MTTFDHTSWLACPKASGRFWSSWLELVDKAGQGSNKKTHSKNQFSYLWSTNQSMVWYNLHFCPTDTGHIFHFYLITMLAARLAYLMLLFSNASSTTSSTSMSSTVQCMRKKSRPWSRFKFLLWLSGHDQGLQTFVRGKPGLKLHYIDKIFGPTLYWMSLTTMFLQPKLLGTIYCVHVELQMTCCYWGGIWLRFGTDFVI